MYCIAINVVYDESITKYIKHYFFREYILGNIIKFSDKNEEATFLGKKIFSLYLRI